MSNNVLLTAFKPFGIRGVVTKKNISKEVCDALFAERASRVNYVVLEVGPPAESQIAAALGGDPKGVLLTGEDLSMLGPQVRIEPKAYDPAQQINLTVSGLVPWGVLTLRPPGTASITSGFAEQAANAAGGRRVAFHPGIGSFWCNRIYYLALKWGQRRGCPVLFVHLGVFGQFQEKLAAMRAILDLMLRKSWLNRQAAAEYAKAHAADSYDQAKLSGNGKTWCAKHVRLAILAGGITVQPTEFARDSGPNLIAVGFHEVSSAGYAPQLVDVVVFQGTSATPEGHMQLFDGTQWVSDFKQKDKIWPSNDSKSAWQTQRPAYKIYRYPE
jgi:hypothetical protein